MIPFPVFPRRLAAQAPRAIALLSLAILAGCAVGPDYSRPQADTTPAYKEQPPESWKTAEPKTADATHPWWQLYGDSTLDDLITRANAANQDIHQAEAQYRQARALADAARAGFWPTVTGGVGAGRDRTNTTTTKLGNSYSAGLDASWEPDIWGLVRRSVEAGNADTQASAADLAGARLSIQAALAQDYLQLRVTDLLKDLYARTIAAYTRSLELTQRQYSAGVTLRSDVALAQAQLKTAEAEGIDLDAQRNQLEHAIAILTGRPPASFTLAPVPAQQTWQMHLPAIAAGLPSQLLERRPDIAGAERRVAAANANIGVARAAYYPALLLSASGGFDGGGFAQWFNTPSRVWSLGASLAQTLFDGGLRRARDQQAVAAYDATVAQYKQTVLGGFQEVEDNLSTLRVLEHEITAQDEAVQASRLSERLALAQYRAGTVTYLNVVTAQALTLNNERTAVQLLGRQRVASVALVKAIGGGWNDTLLASAPASDTAAPPVAGAPAPLP
jgi:NodT family efflux transporter outer membrane factor (OMF) lipoprotein